MPVDFFDVKKIASESVNGHVVQQPEEIRRELRSEKIQEIVPDRPGFLVRWGNVLFLSILTLLIIACWFIKYPDLIHAPAKLTSVNAPKRVICGTSGKLVKLRVTENQIVRKNQILGYIESTGNHGEVLKLSSDSDSIEALFTNGESELLQSYFTNLYAKLGELQPAYQVFSQAYYSFRNYLSNGFYVKKKIMLANDMENLKQLHTNLIAQKTLQQQDLALTQKTFEVNESLKNKKVISDFDFRSEQSKLISKKLTLPQINSEVINNMSQQNEKQKEILELENTIDQQRSIFQQALYTFKNQIEEWKKKYLLISPIDGKIAFASFLQENQQLQANQTICFVYPKNTQYFAEIIIPQANFGKVSIGHLVLLKFSSYPFQEFGSVIGKIEFISQVPIDSGYSAKVSLTHGLITTNKKQVPYREGLVASAEIITREMRLLERFYYDIIKQLKR